MGTRSTIAFIPKKEGKEEKPLVRIYQQFDGYIDGVGHDLANFLKSRKICNGIPIGTDDILANGFGDLVAQYIAETKEGTGNFYIDEFDCDQEYNYKVIFDTDKYYNNTELYNGELKDVDDLITIKVNNMFEGTPSELLKFKESDE